MKNLITKVVVLMAGVSGIAFAQQDPQFTQFMHSKLIYNPGYAGTSQAICANVLGRQQWVNFPGAPKTGLLSIDMPIGHLPIAVGLNVMSDQIGYEKTFYARLAFAYNKPLGLGILGIGIDAGVLNKQFNGNWITPDGNLAQDPTIPGFQSNTNPSANVGLVKATYDLGFGIYYGIANKMYVGISSSHLTAQDLVQSKDIKYTLARHYYLVGGYTFNLDPGAKHAINPNIKVKTDAASTQLDINLTYIFQRKLSVGVTYRMQDCIAPMIGYKFPMGLRIGYAYDVTLSKIKGYSSGTHEILLGFCFKTVKPPKVTLHQDPRYFD
jgi:type IX secretion system PorP/SprF family membrane protein